MFRNYRHNHRGGRNNMSFNGFNQGQFNYPHGHGFHYADNRYPPHRAFRPPIPNAVPPPPHDPYFHHAYNGYPPHQAPRPTVPTVVPPVPHTRDNNGNPPHQAPRPTIPAPIPPHQTPEPTIPAKVSPHKTLKPTIPAAIPPHQTPEPTIPAKVSPHKTLKPTIPDVVPVQQLPTNLVCEICNVSLPRKQLEQHKNGRRHRRKVQQQLEYLKRQKNSNGQEANAIRTPNSQVSPVVQPKKVLKSKENRHAVKNVSFKGSYSNSKNRQMSPVVQPKKVLKSKKIECRVENVSFKGPVFNSKYKEGSVKGPERKHGDNIGAKDWRFEVETVSPIFKNKNVPTGGSERKPLDNAGAKDRGFKRKIGEAKVAEGKYMKMNNEIRKQVKSSKPEVSALSISVKSLVQAPELTPSSKGKEYHEIQKPIVEKNDQNQSTPMELRAPVVSNVSSGTKDMSCDFAAIAQPEKHDLPTEMPEGKGHNEIQCKTMVSNDHQQSIAVHAPAGSNINSQTEVLNSDSPAIAVEPQSFTQSDAIACCESQHPAKETDFQTLPSVLMELDVPSGATTNTQTVGESYKDEATMNVLATELGITQLSQVSVCLKCGDEGFEEALVYCNKCQIYALHRYCLDGPVVINDDVTWFCEDCKETIVDISPGASNSINLQQQEIICGSKVVEASSHDPCSLFVLERSDGKNSAKDVSQAIIELTNCIDGEKTNKQQNQHIAAEEEMLLLTYRHSPSHHGPSESSNEFEESEEEIEADSDEGCVINIDPQPIADPIWRGSLDLCNQSFGTVNGLLAHVSSLACSKVLEEARLFPHVLCANVLQRSTVWPKSFMEFGPDRQSIALYFFPETERVERVFDKLVEDMISKDLAISTMVENAELLIFPSTVLPIQYRRFQAKYYLWGVFRAKETSPKTNDVVSEEDKSPIFNNSPSNTLGTSGSYGSSCASNH